MTRSLLLGACVCLVLAGCEKDSTPLITWDAINTDVIDSGLPPDGVDDSTVFPDTGYDPVDMYGVDNDGDGFTPADGDCNDAEAAINPMAYDDPENLVDDDCDTVPDNPVVDCDCGAMPTMIEGMELCDSRFIVAMEQISLAPGGAAGQGVRSNYGTPGANDLYPRYGCSFSILDTGNIDPTVDVCTNRQPGTDFYDPSGAGWDFCLGGEPDPDPRHIDPDPYICDTQQLAITFRAPSNALGFSFDFLYMSTEYPEWVDEGFNDTFYAILDRPTTGELLNISFDDFGQEIEVDNAFFEDPPTTNLAGSGYSDYDFGEICGSSTGWLRTSWEITPNEQFTLVFSIHDEGDGIYDSMVILDNFVWEIGEVDPGTVII